MVFAEKVHARPTVECGSWFYKWNTVLRAEVPRMSAFSNLAVDFFQEGICRKSSLHMALLALMVEYLNPEACTLATFRNGAGSRKKEVSYKLVVIVSMPCPDVTFDSYL